MALSSVVSEILHVEKWRDLEIRVRGQGQGHFLDIRLVTRYYIYTVILKPALGSLKVMGTDTCRSAPMISY